MIFFANSLTATLHQVHLTAIIYHVTKLFDDALRCNPVAAIEDAPMTEAEMVARGFPLSYVIVRTMNLFTWFTFEVVNASAALIFAFSDGPSHDRSSKVTTTGI